MWDLQTLVRLNEEAVKRFRAMRQQKFEQVKEKLEQRGHRVTPVFAGEVVVGADFQGGKDKSGRIVFDADAYLVHG